MILRRKAALVSCMFFLTWGCASSRAAAQSAQKRGESIQQLVDLAYQSNKRKVRIPPGTYRVVPPESGSHLQFEKLSHFEISGWSRRAQWVCSKCNKCDLCFFASARVRVGC